MKYRPKCTKIGVGGEHFEATSRKNDKLYRKMKHFSKISVSESTNPKTFSYIAEKKFETSFQLVTQRLQNQKCEISGIYCFIKIDHTLRWTLIKTCYVKKYRQKCNKIGVGEEHFDATSGINDKSASTDKLYMNIGGNDVIEVGHPTMPEDAVLVDREGVPQLRCVAISSWKPIVHDDALSLGVCRLASLQLVWHRIWSDVGI